MIDSACFLTDYFLSLSLCVCVCFLDSGSDAEMADVKDEPAEDGGEDVKMEVDEE